MGSKTLRLGYAIALTDALLAPFTPSNTARSGGTIYPIIRHLPELYQSRPNDPSARRLGSYIMWVAIAATSVTSSLFLTGLAPNLLAVELVKKTVGVEIGWVDWFLAFAPAGIALLLATPLLAYWLYPPEVKESARIPEWAASELRAMGKLTARETLLGALVVMALSLWIFGADFINATTVALTAVTLMLLARIVSWDDIVKHSAAWNTLAWFATLVALADGLARVGFVKWFAESIGHQVAGVSPVAAMLVLTAVFFVVHYLFASITAQVTAVLPVMLAVGAAIPGMPHAQYALLLCLSLGVMGIISPYATGPSPVYYGSGYLPAADYWRLGALFGGIFLAVLLLATPWLFLLR
jgi:L-tartrate/succinate antiporter